MKHIKNLLPNIHTTTDNQKQWKFALMQNWSTIMGTLVTKVSIYKIYNQSIVLGVSDSSWMHELYLLSDLIKKKINKTLDKPRIETIRFQFISNNPKKDIQKKETIVSLPKNEIKPLSEKQKKVLQKIKDPELAKALTGLLQKCHQ